MFNGKKWNLKFLIRLDNFTYIFSILPAQDFEDSVIFQFCKLKPLNLLSAMESEDFGCDKKHIKKILLT